MKKLVLVLMVLPQFFLVQANAVRSDGSELNPPKLMVGHPIAEPPSWGAGADSSSSDGKTESSVAQAPVIRRLREKHRLSDRSVAGGGVILGGFFTAMFAAIYCYIRVTRTSYGDDNKH
ncbi:hypothetical protein LOK49_LG06G01519 [Camellia lanceoleosa]|uniref:Uncharacterized protein n=1 Tax=Camellia lanceoleosa TaxID=1840588 RepID=A0ACC0HD06_9ERIC|nr:hypothetical protein LOK49_LG06G01519 [Camellia lanceoleosa]